MNLAARCEILSLIAQENRNKETRAGSQAVLAEIARYHGDLTSAVALMREAMKGVRPAWNNVGDGFFTSPFRADAG